MLYFRWIIFLGLTILSIIGIMPTYDYYSNYFGKDNFDNLSSVEELKDRSLTLGLDLQGGSYLLLEINSDTLVQEKIQDKVIPIKKLLKENNIKYSNFKINNQSLSVNISELDKIGEMSD